MKILNTNDSLYITNSSFLSLNVGNKYSSLPRLSGLLQLQCMTTDAAITRQAYNKNNNILAMGYCFVRDESNAFSFLMQTNYCNVACEFA